MDLPRDGDGVSLDCSEIENSLEMNALRAALGVASSELFQTSSLDRLGSHPVSVRYAGEEDSVPRHGRHGKVIPLPLLPIGKLEAALDELCVGRFQDHVFTLSFPQRGEFEAGLYEARLVVDSGVPYLTLGLVTRTHLLRFDHFGEGRRPHFVTESLGGQVERYFLIVEKDRVGVMPRDDGRLRSWQEYCGGAMKAALSAPVGSVVNPDARG